MGFNIVVTIFLSVSLKAMWNMVHVIQVIIFFPNLVEWPPNAQLLVDSFNEAVTLESFTNKLYEKFLPGTF